MERPRGHTLHRWWIPLATALIFFLSLAFLVPYATALEPGKKPLGILILSLCKFGTSPTSSPLDYTYCAFVPFIFAYLVFLRKDEIARATVRGSNAALWAVALGILLYWFGIRAEMQYFGYAALQVLLGAVILWLWGWAVFRILLFPWAFFIFAWPMPFLDPVIAFPLRMVMSHLAALLLPLLGIPCIQNGTALVSAPDAASGLAMGARFQIDIADPCSGIRSLFALLMFSALFGYLFLPRVWQQWLIFLSAVPLAIIGNLARVILLVLGSIWFGTPFAIGTPEAPSTFHEACGFAIYGVALGAEFLLAKGLTWRQSRPGRPGSGPPVLA